MDSIVVCWVECIFILAMCPALQIDLQPVQGVSPPFARCTLGHGSREPE